MFRRLPCPLTSKELLERGQQLAAVQEESEQLEEARKAADATAKAEIKRLDERATRLRRDIIRKEEDRDIECDVAHDYIHGLVTVTRVDSGEVVEERPMRMEERQATLITEDGEETELDEGAEAPESDAAPEPEPKPKAKGRKERQPAAEA
jgi:hypothetical protein